MKQELKKLLIKDLCSRLSYGLKVKKPDDGNSDYVSAIDVDAGTLTTVYNGYTDKIEKFIPYLRPMSSMTPEEIAEYSKMTYKDGTTVLFDVSKKDHNMFVSVDLGHLDWLTSHHFDYRELIKKGLALEAPNGMYK